MNQLGWALIHFLWQGTLAALVLAAALPMLRSPRSRYAAACLTMLAMALCVPATIVRTTTTDFPTAVGSGSSLVLEDMPAASGSSMWLNWLVWTWAFGASALLLRAGAGWRVARRRSRSGIPWSYPVARLMERMGMTGRIELLISKFADAPQVFGWVKPVILVPAAAVANLSPAELEAVLAHELAHILRRDYLVNLIQTVVESLLFYHPAVWWVSTAVRREREHCCDDIAVAACGDREGYSRALLKLGESMPAYAVAATGGDLSMRIARLMGRKREGTGRASGALFVVAVLLLGGVIWASQEAPPPPAPPAPPAAPAPPAMPDPAAGSALSRAPAPQPAPAPPPPSPPGPGIAGQAPPPPPSPPEEEGAEGGVPGGVGGAVERGIQDRVGSAEDRRRSMEEAQRQLQHSLQELSENRRKIEQDLRLALEEAQKNMQKAALRPQVEESMRKAQEELKRQAPLIRQNIEESMKRLQLEWSALQAEQIASDAEREKRRQYADERWSSGGEKGSQTDRGRVYMGHGPPHEIQTAGGAETWKYKNWRGTGGTMTFEFDGEGRLKR